MLQGVCEIELRDEQGNVVQKTKDYNMITNGISAYLDADYNLISRLLKNDDFIDNFKRLTPIIQKIVGGVYLFNNTQDEIVNNIIPDVFSIVGSGSLSKSTISDDRAGIWNIDESDIIYNNDKIIGFKFVWDFLTSKGNGTIRSVSLTSDMGARSMLSNYYIGHYYYYSSLTPYYYGKIAPFNLINPIDEKKSRNTKDYDFNIKPDKITIDIKNGIIGSIGGEIIVFSDYNYSSKSITIEKYKLKDKISLNDSVYGNDTIDALILIDTYIIDLTDMELTLTNDNFMKNGISFSTYLYNGYIYIGYAYNNKVKIKKIDAATMDVTETIKRTFELGDLNTYYKSTSNYCQSPIVPIGNYFAVMRRDKEVKEDKIIFIDKINFTITKEVEICSNDNSLGGVYKPINYGYIENVLYIFIECQELINGSYSTSYKTIVVDSNLNIIKKNTNIFMDRSLPIQSDIFKYPYLLTKKVNYYNSNNAWLVNNIKNDLLVSANTKLTIDNLSTPVTKTASQTMKVIYTIKDVEEQSMSE